MSTALDMQMKLKDNPLSLPYAVHRVSSSKEARIGFQNYEYPHDTDFRGKA